MIYRECPIPKFHLLTVFLGSLILFASCGQSLESHLERGEQFLEQRRYDDAVMQFRAAADIDETSADALWGLARSYESQEKFLETIETLRRVVDIAPENLAAQAKLGNYYLLFNPPQIQDSERILKDILKRDKKYVEAHILKASIYSTRGMSENKIVQTLKHAISLDKKRTESYLALSRFYMKVNNAEAAESTIKEAIEVSPKQELGYIEYGRFLTYSRRTAEAEEQFEKAVEVAPMSVEAGLALASFYVSNRENRKAEQKFKDLVKIQENRPESRMDLANFYRLAGQNSNAVKVLEKILNESEDYARAR